MLTQAVESYLAVRRAAGFALRCQGSYLKSFAAFSGARKQHYVSTDIAIEWAGLAPSVPQRARRLGIVIRFARYLRTEDVRHEVPPAVFGRDRRSRPTPYILTEKQIQQLVLTVEVSTLWTDLQHPVLLAVLHGITRVRSDPPTSGRHHARWTTDPTHEIS
jgi:site-specific recombinase XerD